MSRVFSTPYPETSWRIAWLTPCSGNARRATASGRHEGQGMNDVRVVAQAGDGGPSTLDSGASRACSNAMTMSSSSATTMRYMNTGVQRSGATPPAARTATTEAVGPEPGNVFGQGKDMPRLAMAHASPTSRPRRSQTCTIWRTGRTRNATARRALLHILVPCRSVGDRPRATRSRSLASLRRPVSSRIRSENGCRHRRLKDPSSHERRIVSLDFRSAFAISSRDPDGPTSLLESKRWLIRTSALRTLGRRRPPK